MGYLLADLSADWIMSDRTLSRKQCDGLDSVLGFLGIGAEENGFGL